MAIGNAAAASGANTIAIGTNATAQASVAIGNGAFANTGGTAVGDFSSASGDNTLPVQAQNTAFGNGAQAGTNNAGNTSFLSTAVGAGAQSNNSLASTSVGAGATTNNSISSSAFGDAASANNTIGSTSIGQAANTDNSISSSAFGDAASAQNSIGSTSIGQGANTDNTVASTAVGVGASANGFSGSTALGAGAQNTNSNQMVFGTATETYTAPGITSNLSQSRQSGPLEVVTSDANGNLATDNGALFHEVGHLSNGLDKARAGIALAIAMQGPDLTGNERFGMSANWGDFDGTNGFGMGFEGVVANDFLVTGSRLAFTGGFGVGFVNSSNTNSFTFGNTTGGSSDDVWGGRVGAQWTWGHKAIAYAVPPEPTSLK